MDAEADARRQERAQRGSGQGNAAASQAAAELLAGPGQPAAERPAGQRSRRAASSSVRPSK